MGKGAAWLLIERSLAFGKIRDMSGECGGKTRGMQCGQGSSGEWRGWIRQGKERDAVMLECSFGYWEERGVSGGYSFGYWEERDCLVGTALVTGKRGIVLWVQLWLMGREGLSCGYSFGYWEETDCLVGTALVTGKRWVCVVGAALIAGKRGMCVVGATLIAGKRGMCVVGATLAGGKI